jgi:hypothetical protein
MTVKRTFASACSISQRACSRGVATTRSVMTDGAVDTVIAPAEVAHHEAGHAVAAIYLDRPMLYVTIVPDDNSGGHVKYGNPFAGRA